MQVQNRFLQLVDGIKMPLWKASVAKLLPGPLENRLFECCSKYKAGHSLNMNPLKYNNSIVSSLNFFVSQQLLNIQSKEFQE
jgi:hypothetical protein